MLAEALLDKEVLFQSDVEALIGKRPYEEKRALDVTEHAMDDEPKQIAEMDLTGSSIIPPATEEVK